MLSPLFVIGLSALSDILADLRAAIAVELPMPPPMAIGDPAHEPHPPERPVFRHSVIPGGVYTADEVKAAMGRDHVVAAHYWAIDARELRAEVLPADRMVYMSYRVGDDVFWTKQTVYLKEGETILTDGTESIRARCGNRIAFAPLEPTTDDEPGEMEFDALTETIDIVQSRPPLGHELLLPPVSGFSLPWLVEPVPHNEVAGRETIDIPVLGFPDLSTVPEPSFDLPQVVWPEFVDGDLPPTDAPLVWRPQNPEDPSLPGKPGDPDDPGDPGDPGAPFDPITPTAEIPVVPAPEPATVLLVGGGLATLFARRRRQ